MHLRHREVRMGTRQRPGATWVIVALASSLSLGACYFTYTLDSAIPPDQVNFDSTLLGTWMGPDSLHAVLTPRDNERYLIDLTNGEGNRASFVGKLGKLGEATVLEVWPGTDPDPGDWPVGRMQLVLEIAPDSVVMRFFDPDPIRAALRGCSLDMPYIGASGYENLILGAPTAELARALTAQLGRPGALTNPGIWRRGSRR